MPNLDARGRAFRLVSGVVFIIVGALLIQILEGVGRLFLFAPFLFGVLGLLQAGTAT